MVSIIIRNKDEAEFIGHSIQSCIDSFKNPEIIVVDDNSTDESDRVVSLFDKTDITIYPLPKRCTPDRDWETVAVPASKISVGQYVLLVNGDADESGATAMVIDAETPTPIYKGPKQQGVKVTAYDGISKVKLDAAITPTSDQALIFLDEQHGAGGITAAGQEFPAGLTIYGRWTAFKPSAHGAIAYFGY